MEWATTTVKDMGIALADTVQAVEALDLLKVLEGTAAMVPLVSLMVEVALEVQAAAVAPLADLPVALAWAWALHRSELVDEALTSIRSSSMSKLLSHQSISITAWKAAWPGDKRFAIT